MDQSGTDHILPPNHAQAIQACAALRRTVQEALRTVQTAALDLQDAVDSLRELYEQIHQVAPHAAGEQALRYALADGLAMVRSFEALGLYDPVSIELLE